MLTALSDQRVLAVSVPLPLIVWSVTGIRLSACALTAELE